MSSTTGSRHNWAQGQGYSPPQQRNHRGGGERHHHRPHPTGGGGGIPWVGGGGGVWQPCIIYIYIYIYVYIYIYIYIYNTHTYDPCYNLHSRFGLLLSLGWHLVQFLRVRLCILLFIIMCYCSHYSSCSVLAYYSYCQEKQL